MILGAMQFAVEKNDKQYNLAKIDALIDRTVDLVVLPELFATGYYYDSREQIEAAAEPIPGGYTTQRLIGIAQRKGCHITGALIEADGDELYITAVLAGPNGYVGRHRKRHLTEWEKQYYRYGLDSSTYDVNGCKTGLMVCLEDIGQQRVTFRGDSRIIDVDGNILANAGIAEVMITAQIDEMAATKDLEDCKDFPFEANKHRETMYQ